MIGLPFQRTLVQIRPMDAPAARLTQTARDLAQEGLDALIAVNYGHNSFLESHAVFVLSGVRPIGESAVVVDRGGGPALIVTPALGAARAAALSRTAQTLRIADPARGLAPVTAAHHNDPAQT